MAEAPRVVTVDEKVRFSEPIELRLDELKQGARAIVGVRLYPGAPDAEPQTIPSDAQWHDVVWNGWVYDKTAGGGTFLDDDHIRIRMPASADEKSFQSKLVLQISANATGGRYLRVMRKRVGGDWEEWPGARGNDKGYGPEPSFPFCTSEGTMQELDEYKVQVKQDSGATLSIGSQHSRWGFTFNGVQVDDGGVIITPPPPDPDPPTGDLDFDAEFATKALARFTGANKHPERVSIVPDPGPLGAARDVAFFDVRYNDIANGYPKSQLVTPSFFTAGNDYHIGTAWRAPDSARAYFDAGNLKAVMLQEVYGDPFGKSGPNRIFFSNGKFILKAGPGNGLYDGATPLWQMPAPDDAWVDFDLHYGISKVAGTALDKGFVALGYNTGSGWVNVNLPGSSLVDGEYRYPYPTLQQGTNDNGKNYFAVKVSFADAPDGIINGKNEEFGSMPFFRMYCGGVKIGPTRADVDPHSFA